MPSELFYRPPDLSNTLLDETLNQLDKVRDVLKPPLNAWWWFFKVNVHWWDRLDFTWNILTLVWLAATFSLLTDTVTRFLTSGPGIVGGFAVISQASLALIGGGSLTHTGKQLVERTLERLHLPKHYWQEVRFLGATLLLLIFIGIRSALPVFARTYNNLGYQDYLRGDFSSAENNYQRAISLQPNLAPAHYNLGLLYEDLQNYSEARTEYSLAAKGGLINAYNNLARLEILDGNYLEAFSLLQNSKINEYLADDGAQHDGAENASDLALQYTLLKNTAWALQGMGFHREAINRLQQAIALNEQQENPQASAYCLLAQSLEAINNSQETMAAWESCLKYAGTLQTPEEYEWYFMAGRRIEEGLEKTP